MDQLASVTPVHCGIFGNHTGIASQTKSAALIHILTLTGHKVNDLMLAVSYEFTGVGILESQYISGKFDHCDLHTQTNTEVWNFLFSGESGRQDHPFYAAPAEATGNKDAIQSGQGFS